MLERAQYDDARSTIEEALAIARASANRRIEANCVAALGDLAWRLGRQAEAVSLLSEAEATLRELSDAPLLADLLCTRGLLDLARGDAAAARTALYEAMQIAAAMHVGPASTLNRGIERLSAAVTARESRDAGE